MGTSKRIDLKLGFRCNNRCLFCVQGKKREQCEILPSELLIQILKNERKEYDSVVFTGGEPTLHPELLKLVEEASELGYTNIQIQTNGRMCAYRTFCQDLIRAGATEFSPAVHGHVSTCHDYLTQVMGSFEQTIQGIRNLKELGQKIITNTVITRSNFRHLPELAELLVFMGIFQYQLAFVHPIGRAGKGENFDTIVPRFELILPYVHKALDIGIESGVKVMTEAIPFCFMRGYEEYIGERFIPQTKIFDAQEVIEDYGQYRQDQGKEYGEGCKKCPDKNVCEGLWKEYPDRFGWEEFRKHS